MLAADAGGHAIDELPDVTAGQGGHFSLAVLAFTDVDLNDTHAVSVSAAAATWSGGAALPAGLQSVLDAAASTTLADSTQSGAGAVGRQLPGRRRARSTSWRPAKP